MFGSFLWETQHDAQTMRLSILAKDRAFFGVGLEPECRSPVAASGSAIESLSCHAKVV
jgi:hypothetical protein